MSYSDSEPVLVAEKKIPDALDILLQRIPDRKPISGCREVYQISADVHPMMGRDIRNESIDSYAKRYINKMEEKLNESGILPNGTKFDNWGLNDCWVDLNVHLPIGGDDPRSMEEILKEEDALVQNAFNTAHDAVVRELRDPPKPRVRRKPAPRGR